MKEGNQKVHPFNQIDTMMDSEEQELTEHDQENDQEHDQLPDVEEYKASVGHRKKSSDRLMDLVRRPDPEGHDSAYKATSSEKFIVDAGDDGDDIIMREDFHELPRLGKYTKSQARLPWGRRVWKICGIVSFVLLVAVVLAIVFATGGDGVPDFWHFLEGDTDSYREIKDYVTGVAELSDPKVFDGQTSPQYYAAQWLAHGDGLQKSVPKNNNVHYNERYAMAVLYFSLGGPQWTHQLNFLSPDHICTWYQEFEVISGKDQELDQSYSVYGVHACRDDGSGELAPHAIYLPANGLNGTIPSEIEGLVRLESLEIQSNPGVTGTLPEGLQQLTGLNRLMLQWCELNGEIPSWISKMTGLRSLGLGSNGLSGSLPLDIGALDKLEILGLDGNQLYGNIDLFFPMTDLKSLYLDNNYFTGTLSDAWMDSLSLLEEVDMSDNVLDGVLPANFFNHHNDKGLEVIDLHGNQIAGNIPASIEENSVLQFLALHENKFDGVLPDSLSNLKELKHLDLSVNGFTGMLPQSLYVMTTLEYLFIGENPFDEGPMPMWMIQLSNLRELSMKDNKLTGSIPDVMFPYLKDLQFLDLHLNRLVGEIPTNIWLLSDLRHLLLKMNDFSGTLPSTMNQLTNLEVLLIEQNFFIGDADVICDEDFALDAFVADCDDASTGIVCSCCTTCCMTGDALCNTFEFNWRGNLDPVWQYGYRRERYAYHSDIWTSP